MQNLQAINTSYLYKLSIQGRNKVYEIRDQRLRVSGGMVREMLFQSLKLKNVLKNKRKGRSFSTSLPSINLLTASNMKGGFVSKRETKVKELACLKRSIFLHLSLSILILTR